ncbi:hypothetical protein ACJRO7_031188 [Eucalyptus globulus]|uniref:Secreted protein n=1 Tax=Eucalyptus globulus TaxID=34317 RepID=A0ABD3JK71_EUCGL
MGEAGVSPSGMSHLGTSLLRVAAVAATSLPMASASSGCLATVADCELLRTNPCLLMRGPSQVPERRPRRRIHFWKSLMPLVLIIKVYAGLQD